MKNFDFSLRIGPSCSFFSCYLKYWSVIVIEFQSHNFSEILVSEMCSGRVGTHVLTTKRARFEGGASIHNFMCLPRLFMNETSRIFCQLKDNDIHV